MMFEDVVKKVKGVSFEEAVKKNISCNAHVTNDVTSDTSEPKKSKSHVIVKPIMNIKDLDKIAQVKIINIIGNLDNGSHSSSQLQGADEALTELFKDLLSQSNQEIVKEIQELKMSKAGYISSMSSIKNHYEAKGWNRAVDGVNGKIDKLLEQLKLSITNKE